MISGMEWLLQLAAGQLMAIGFGRTDAALQAVMEVISTLVTLFLRLVVQALHHQVQLQLQVILMVILVAHHGMETVMVAATVDGAGHQTTLLSGTHHKLTADVISEIYYLYDKNCKTIRIRIIHQ